MGTKNFLGGGAKRKKKGPQKILRYEAKKYFEGRQI